MVTQFAFIAIIVGLHLVDVLEIFLGIYYANHERVLLSDFEEIIA